MKTAHPNPARRRQDTKKKYIGFEQIKKILLFLPAFLSILFTSVLVSAARAEGLSGKIRQEIGFQRDTSGDNLAYQYSHGLLEYKKDLHSSISIDLAGEYNWQSSTWGMFPSWPVYFQKNGAELETEPWSDSDGKNLLSLRLSRASVSYASGRLDMTLGLQEFNWGSSRFWRPTCFFNPLPPLAWMRDLPLASEGLDATCYLFDYLSLEAGARWLDGGTFEEVVRLVNRGIGITVTPSFARLTGRNALGLELVGTFPDLKAWLEGVDWLYPGGSSSVEWVAGLSTVHDGATYTLEVIRDETGGVLGNFSSVASRGTYISPYFERKFPGGWNLTGALAFALEGGPLLFWPKGSWDFSPSWEWGFQAQVLAGPSQGPLCLIPTRLGTWVSYSF
jgi:hypothetical protein